VTRAVVPLQAREQLARHLFSELRPHVVRDLMVTARQLEALRTLVHEVGKEGFLHAYLASKGITNSYKETFYEQASKALC